MRALIRHRPPICQAVSLCSPTYSALGLQHVSTKESDSPYPRWWCLSLRKDVLNCVISGMRTDTPGRRHFRIDSSQHTALFGGPWLASTPTRIRSGRNLRVEREKRTTLFKFLFWLCFPFPLWLRPSLCPFLAFFQNFLFFFFVVGQEASAVERCVDLRVIWPCWSCITRAQELAPQADAALDDARKCNAAMHSVLVVLLLN